MAEHPDGDRQDPLGGDVRTPADPHGDRDLDLRGILGFALGVVLLVVVGSAVGLGLYFRFRAALVRQDPPPPPLPEARAPVVPPEPRLQRSPTRDMEELRAREEQVLHGYGWVDRRAQIARIPIERAIELTLQRGLGPLGGDAVAGGAAADGGAP